MHMKTFLISSIGTLTLSIALCYGGHKVFDQKIQDSILNTIKITDKFKKSDIKLVEDGKVFQAKDEKGNTFYILYNEKFGDAYNIRMIDGDGFLFHNENIIQYMNYKKDKINDQDENSEPTKKSNEHQVKDVIKKSEIAPSIKPKDISETSGNSESNDENISKSDSLVREDGSVIEGSNHEADMDDANSSDNRIETTKDRMISKLSDKEKEVLTKKLPEVANKNFRKQSLSKISNTISEVTIDYPAHTEKVKGIINAFVDPTCPYCKKFHGDIEKLRYKGYTVRYIPIPKDGMNSLITPQIAAVSCSSKSRSPDLMDQLFKGNRFDTSNMPEKCTNNIQMYFNLILSIGADRTPYIFSDKGEVSQGYSGVDNLLSDLKENDSN